MKKLIVNADDFGLTDGCNKGIVDAIKNGIVTSTTIMMNMPKAKDAIELAKENGITQIGIHLTLTSGKPVLPSEDIPSLVNEEGKFHKRRWDLFPNMNQEEAKKELRAQIEKFLESGLELSHMDSHHHIHMYDELRETVVDLAKEYNVALRNPDEKTKDFILQNDVKTTDYFSMDFYGEEATIDKLKELIDTLEEGTMEIMVHPAYVDEQLKSISSYNEQRFNEFTMLTNRDMKKWIEDKGIQLVNFTQI